MMKTKSKHPLWRRWTQIKFMMTNERHEQHKYYIDLPMVGFDDFWEFAEFVEREIGAIPSATHKLARKNQRAGYVRGNLYWARDNRDVGQRFFGIAKFRVGGKMLTYRQMSEASGIRENTIRSRIERGWTPRDAMTIPALPGQKIYA
jgi:hypothetical protein